MVFFMFRSAPVPTVTQNAPFRPGHSIGFLVLFLWDRKYKTPFLVR